MGAYRYCECSHPLPKPTAREDLLDGQYCPGCGAEQQTDKGPREWIVDLDERLEGIETQKR